MTTGDDIDLLSFVHPPDGSVIADELVEAALKAAVAVFVTRQIEPAAAISAWHARDHFTRMWIASSTARKKPLTYTEWLATIQPPAASQRMEATANAWDEAQAAAAKIVQSALPDKPLDHWMIERVPSLERRHAAATRRLVERF